MTVNDKAHQKTTIMRQKKYFIAILAAMLLIVPAMVQSKKGQAVKKSKTLEVSFDTSVRLVLVPTNMPSGLRMTREKS